MQETGNKLTKYHAGILLVAIPLMIFVIKHIYQPGLYGPLLLDDNEVINRLLIDDIDVNSWHRYVYSDSGILRRPISMLSFLLNSIASSDDIFMWKYTNLMIHVINGILVLYLSYLILFICNNINKNRALITGLIISIIWIVHPLHVSTILYTVQRMTELSALFLFAALIFYILGRNMQFMQKRSSVYFIPAFCLFFPLSILSKENGVIMPLVCILLEIFYFKFASMKESKSEFDRILLIVLITPILASLVFLLLNYDALLIDGYRAREFTLIQRLLTESRILFIYIFHIVMPIQRYMGFIHDDIQISSNLLNPPQTLVSLVLFIGLIVLIVKSYKLNKNISLGLSIFVTTHLIESTILPLELMFEHRNYLPSYGIIFAVVCFVEYLSINIRYLTYTCIIMLMALVTIQRVNTWSSLPSLYDYMFKIHPGSPRMAMIKARIYMDEGEYDKARDALYPYDKTGTKIQLLNIECREKKIIKDDMFVNSISNIYKPVDMAAIAEIELLSASGLNGYCNYSTYAILSLLDKLIELPVINRFQLHKLYVYKAYHLWGIKKREDAIHNLEKAAELVDNDPVPYIFAAAWSHEIGDIEAYNKYYREVVEINKRTLQDYSEEIQDLNMLKTEH